MTTASQAVARIREALEKGDAAMDGREEASAVITLMSAAKPDALRALLAERDALVKAAYVAMDVLDHYQHGGSEFRKQAVAAIEKLRAALAAAPGGEGAKT